MPEKRYVIGGADGWLNVKREPTGTVVALPQFIQVEASASNAGRERSLSSSRFSERGLHTVAPSDWTRFYQYLILCRGNDAKTVGMVSVAR